MPKKKRGRRRLRVGVAGLACVAAASVASEVKGIWYCEDPGRPSTFFAVDRSTVVLIYTPSPPEGWFSGIPLYEQGWSTRSRLVHQFQPRQWSPVMRTMKTAGSRFYEVVLPLWAPALVFAVSAAWGWRAGRELPGRCRGCRYDLRGLAGGVCPECGAASGARGR
ncbi:MAG: hypothetical protein K2Q09_03115 [Phycisphaerales bacterium]|nr:hypothetical protein [Phycisphaerales bacterium]